LVETLDNGKPIRETTYADMPLVVDHWRYFASVVRGQEGGISEIDRDTVAYHYHEPLGVVGQIIPWNFPILMATWKLAPALAAGNCVVLKPAEQTPLGILVVMELIADILPPGVINVVNGFGVEAGKPLAQNKRIAKIAFTGETTTGRLIMQYASDNIIPVTLEPGGKSPNIFFADVADADDDYFDKAIEGFAMFALNQGEVCTCPSRALVQESIHDRFMERAVAPTKKIKQGHPLDATTMIGAQASNDQLEKILCYFDIGRQEGAKVLTGGQRAVPGGELAEGYYVEPTIFEGNNKMRVFQEEIFGPVVSVAKFKDDDEALAIANDTLYGLGAGVWTRNGNRAYRFGRAIQAGRVWTNCYHAYPAYAAFGGYKACRLDVGQLLDAGAEVASAIDEGADLLIVNRFGRQEREGRRLLHLVELALSADIPVVIAVPSHRFAEWIRFANGMSVRLGCDRGSLDAWWRAVSARGASTFAPDHLTSVEYSSEPPVQSRVPATNAEHVSRMILDRRNIATLPLLRSLVYRASGSRL